MDLRSAAVYVIPKSLGLLEPSILETPGTKPKYPKPNTTTMTIIMSPTTKLLMSPIQHLPSLISCEMECKRVVCHLNASMERPSLMSDVVARSIPRFLPPTQFLNKATYRCLPICHFHTGGLHLCIAVWVLPFVSRQLHVGEAVQHLFVEEAGAAQVDWA